MEEAKILGFETKRTYHQLNKVALNHDILKIKFRK